MYVIVLLTALFVFGQLLNLCLSDSSLPLYKTCTCPWHIYKDCQECDQWLDEQERRGVLAVHSWREAGLGLS